MISYFDLSQYCYYSDLRSHALIGRKNYATSSSYLFILINLLYMDCQYTIENLILKCFKPA